MLNYFPKVKSVSLAGNPIISLFGGKNLSTHPTSLLSLDISFVEMRKLDLTFLRFFPNLQSLNLSNCHVHSFQGQGFHWVTSLRVLDVRGCPLTTIPKSLFRGLTSMRRIFSENYKVCCPAILPAGFEGDQCLGSD